MCVSEEEMGCCSYVSMCMVWLFAVTQQEPWLLVTDWLPTTVIEDQLKVWWPNFSVALMTMKVTVVDLIQWEHLTILSICGMTWGISNALSHTSWHFHIITFENHLWRPVLQGLQKPIHQLVCQFSSGNSQTIKAMSSHNTLQGSFLQYHSNECKIKVCLHLISLMKSPFLLFMPILGKFSVIIKINSSRQRFIVLIRFLVSTAYNSGSQPGGRDPQGGRREIMWGSRQSRFLVGLPYTLLQRLWAWRLNYAQTLC